MTDKTGGFVLEQTAMFEAPPERIFAILTEPPELAKWWEPHGFTTPEIHLDLRAGGTYRLTMQPPDGDVFHLSGEFLEVQPPGKLSFTFRWDEPAPDDRETVVVLRLESRGDSAMVSLSHGEFATKERLELHRSGWADSFQRLEAVVQTRGA